jgi:glycosyltransferase involved in cell wall biosynthesis
LTEELVRQGHRVTLFATADSKTSAELVPVIDRPLRGDPHWLTHALVQLERVIDRAGDFDVLHFHTDHLHYPLLRYLEVPVVTTLHGRLDIPGLQPLHQVYSDAAVVSISEAQQGPLPEARWVGVVPHGLPPALYRPGTGAGGYLAFVGRVSPEKRLDRAVEIARRAGLPLHVGAKVDPADRKYFEREIEPLLGTSGVQVPWRDRRPAEDGPPRERARPPVSHRLARALRPGDDRGDGLRDARARLPWRCRRGGARDGVTGAIVDTVEQAVAALPGVLGLDRAACREEFERRFSVRRMARDYVRVYQRLMDTPRRVAAPGWSAEAASHG